jgi:hypothetical protein
MDGWLDRNGKRTGKNVRGEEEKGSKRETRKEEEKTWRRPKCY